MNASLLKNQIIFSLQRGGELLIVAKNFKVSLDYISKIVQTITKKGNLLYVSQSFTDNNIFYIFTDLEERKLEVDEELTILNRFAFSFEEILILESNYVFKRRF